MPLNSPPPVNSRNTYGDRKLRRLMLFVYLTPILGTFPALWSLYTRTGDAKQQRISRISLMLACLWLAGTVGFTISSQQTEAMFVPFLLVSSLWTSGYFLISIGLMARLWKNKPLFPAAPSTRKP